MGPDVHGREVGREGAAVPRGWRERVDPILGAVVFALFARTFLFQAFEVPSGSMEKSVLTGDRLLVNKFVFGRTAHSRAAALPERAVRRGDVLVFRYPRDPRRDFIKRVVALPGETVAIRNKHVFVDGRLLDEPWAFHADDTVWPDDAAIAEEHRRRDQMPATRVPEGTYFVMGDNRDDSSDSRYWGPVPAANVLGRALVVYWSFRPRPSDTPSGPAAFARWPIETMRRARWDRIFRAVR